MCNNTCLWHLLIIALIGHFLLLYAMTAQASVYPNDDFLIHKLCIKNPWVANNTTPKYQGDSTSAYPCHYDYAIVHVPTYNQELAKAASTSGQPMKLYIEIAPADYQDVGAAFSLGFGTSITFLFTSWGMGRFLKGVWTGGRSFW